MDKRRKKRENGTMLREVTEEQEYETLLRSVRAGASVEQLACDIASAHRLELITVEQLDYIYAVLGRKQRDDHSER